MPLPTPNIYPQERQIAPDFILQSSTGTEYQMSRLRGRRNVVLLVAGTAEGPTTALARALATRGQELREEEALVLEVVWGDVATAQALHSRDLIPFPVLADPDGAVHQRYGAPAVYVTDRYGEIYGAHRDPLPSADDILASLRHINSACPE
jgi:peroxiredoxin